MSHAIPVSFSATANSLSSTETTYLLTANLPDSAQNLNGPTGKASGRPVLQFYRIMLRGPRVLAGLANVILTSWIPASFNTTLPTHLHETFDLKSSSIGMVFACFTVPSLLLGGSFGYLRNGYGLRIPNLIGCALLAPLLLVSSLAGSPRFPWVSEEKKNGVCLNFLYAWYRDRHGPCARCRRCAINM